MYFSTCLKKWHFSVVACLGLLLTGCSNGPSPSKADDGRREPGIAVQIDSSATEVADVKDDSTANAEAIANADVYYATCGGQVVSMADILKPIASKLESQQMPYKISQKPVDEWRDCSGNFLRLSSYVASACAGNEGNLAAPAGIKDYVAGGDNKAPENTGPRSSRGIGQWYYDQGRYIPIYYDGITDISQPPQDLIDKRHLIKPGAVVWFSRGMPISSDGVDSLWTYNSKKSQINHMATIISVEKDDDGNVIRFSMYHGHGRDGVTPASVTDKHFWEWPATYTSNGSKYPPFGYWGQYLVGIGTLLPTEAPPSGPEV